MSSTSVNTFQSTLPSKGECRGTKDLVSFRFCSTIYKKIFLILNESQSKYITQNILIFTKYLIFCNLNGTTQTTIIPDHPHCVKSVQIRSFSGSCFPVFTPNTGKYGPEKFPYLDTFQAVPF